MNNKDLKKFKQIAHHLDPVVIVGDSGLTASVLAETQRALADHELIKIKLAGGDKADRDAMLAQILEQTAASKITQIGKVAVIYRGNPIAKPMLSNVQRFNR